jgi:aspartate aminotransferase
VAGQVTARRITEIVESMAPFLGTLIDPEFERVRADPEAADFMFGNPQEVASRQYVDTLKRWLEPKDKNWFAYSLSNRPAQEAAAAGLSRELGIEFAPDDIVLTRGAHGALAAGLTVALDPGDEVIYISPPWFFYDAMIRAAGGVPVKVRVRPGDFDLDLDAIAAAITPRTRMLLLNTPHNPTGRIFPSATLARLAELLETASQENQRPIYILSDEAYSRILYEGSEMQTPATHYPRTFLVHTYSKTALAPGQRVGFLALPPGIPGREELRLAFMAAGAATGNMGPDALMVYALPEIEEMLIDLPHLQRKRDRVVDALRELGYEVHIPEGTFYLLPKSPIPDDVAFAHQLLAHKVAVLPGQACDMPGYFRLCLTATDEMIDRALPAFARVMEEAAAAAG